MYASMLRSKAKSMQSAKKTSNDNQIDSLYRSPSQSSPHGDADDGTSGARSRRRNLPANSASKLSSPTKSPPKTIKLILYISSSSWKEEVHKRLSAAVQLQHVVTSVAVGTRDGKVVLFVRDGGSGPASGDDAFGNGLRKEFTSKDAQPSPHDGRNGYQSSPGHAKKDAQTSLLFLPVRVFCMSATVTSVILEANEVVASDVFGNLAAFSLKEVDLRVALAADVCERYTVAVKRRDAVRREAEKKSQGVYAGESDEESDSTRAANSSVGNAKFGVQGSPRNKRSHAQKPRATAARAQIQSPNAGASSPNAPASRQHNASISLAAQQQRRPGATSVAATSTRLTTSMAAVQRNTQNNASMAVRRSAKAPTRAGQATGLGARSRLAGHEQGVSGGDKVGVSDDNERGAACSSARTAFIPDLDRDFDAADLVKRSPLNENPNLLQKQLSDLALIKCVRVNTDEGADGIGTNQPRAGAPFNGSERPWRAATDTPPAAAEDCVTVSSTAEAMASGFAAGNGAAHNAQGNFTANSQQTRNAARAIKASSTGAFVERLLKWMPMGNDEQAYWPAGLYPPDEVFGGLGEGYGARRRTPCVRC